MSKIDGELVGKMGLRWCDGCVRLHGPLYPCERYPDSVLAEIATADRKWREQLRDPKWRARQAEAGVPTVVLDVFKALARGLRP